MIQVNIHAGGHANYLEKLATRLQEWIKKINRDPDLSPLEKADARKEAKKSVQKDKKESLKNCY
ncbi:hypothetical protein ACLOAU_20620 [Niabella sp. CJ426]|uniref:hypothetical protein n=1 Tax=Niabella sp. CJ426 TaxID=3393740 RepID=UPI003D04E08D